MSTPRTRSEWKLGVCFLVTLSAGDDADVEASLGEGKRHIRQKLSRGCVIWIEEAVEKNGPPRCSFVAEATEVAALEELQEDLAPVEIDRRSAV